MAPKVLKATKGSRSGANDGKKGSKAAGIGAVVEGGAMATAVLQRKAVGSLSGGVEAQVRTLLRAVAVDGRVLAAFSGLWDALAAAGFGPEHVKRVFMELPREWILRYMDDQASSGGEEEDGGQAKPGSSASSLADFEWELWGDPREARQALAEEWAKTKEVAARAKSAGDKARQKDAGLMLRDLKQEMASMKVTEQQLEAILSGAPVLPAATAAAAAATPAAGKAAAGKAAAGKAAAASAAAEPAPEPPKTPRALLSQLCMKMAWSQPRGVAKKRNLYGVRVYSIPSLEQPEGPPLHRSWPEPPAAQDAAAARALYEVAPPLQLQQSTFQASPAGRAMQEARAGLPIAAVRGEVLAALRDGDVVVVSGE
eukprot:XP_001696542.1 predicted protein [Chlamydomonas reinhardtii]